MLNTELNEIKNNFLLFDAQLDKFEYLIDIGKSCKGMKDKNKIERNQIIGCASQSWVVCNKKNNQFFIDVDSEAHLVRGLLSILQVAIQGLSKEDIIDLDGEKILNEIGLGNSITSQRMNGFLSALSTIKQLVKQYD